MNTQITDDHVSFEVAKLLKEKGFNIDECEVNYDPLDHTQYDITLQMAMKWLREEHNLYIVIVPESDIEVFYIKGFYFDIWTPVGNKYDRKIYRTYEEACEAAIKYCLTNLI